jgi:hypothetical protein
MPISVPGSCRSLNPGDVDHSFRGDPDPRNVFHKGEVTPDTTEGQLFSHLIYGETECQPFRYILGKLVAQNRVFSVDGRTI